MSFFVLACLLAVSTQLKISHLGFLAGTSYSLYNNPTIHVDFLGNKVIVSGCRRYKNTFTENEDQFSIDNADNWIADDRSCNSRREDEAIKNLNKAAFWTVGGNGLVVFYDTDGRDVIALKKDHN